MNLSHVYSDRAPKPRNYLGIGVVVALHLAGIYALSAGLIRTTAAPPGPITVRSVEETVKPPPPIDEVEPVTPILRDVPVRPIPVNDDFVVRNDPPPVGPTTAPLRDVPDGGGTQGNIHEVAPPPARSKPEVTAAGAVCSVMPAPEVPAVNWTGEAVLQVLATVRGGRVVGSDVRVMQGALDGRTRRSLQRSVESALAGYQCQGDAMFQQDFAFRID